MVMVVHFSVTTKIMRKRFLLAQSILELLRPSVNEKRTKKRKPTMTMTNDSEINELLSETSDSLVGIKSYYLLGINYALRQRLFLACCVIHIYDPWYYRSSEQNTKI